MRIFASAFLFCIALTAAASGQNGGKAEANRVVFEAGSRSRLTGNLSNGQEMEYVFRAIKGQTVTVTNPTALFDFRIFRPENEFETEFESSRTLTFVVPDTGDYYFYVRKKQVNSPKRARFSMSVVVK